MYQKKGVFSNGTKQGEEIQKALENAKAPWQKSVHQAILLRENYYRSDFYCFTRRNALFPTKSILNPFGLTRPIRQCGS